MENEEFNSAQGVEPNHQEQSLVEETPAVVTEVGEINPPTKPGPKFSKKHIIVVLLAVVIVLVGTFLFFKQDRHVAVKQFTNVYSFVPEKISKSAQIQISVPEGVSEQDAKKGISLSPEVEGSWVEEEIEKVVIFQPKKPLRVGVYYAVNMDTEAVQMSGDFYVDEDPKVEVIFPANGSESHEDSEITIVFNRPMVPLTTLSEQEKTELPITITPETPGKFKWITTRNLQFIPETTLVPSSNYVVKIESGMYSIDGLPIAPVTHEFVTRPLRYEFVSNGYLGYRAPIIINFNQPVDLDKSKNQIYVTNQSEGNVAIDIEYGEITYYDREKKKYVSEEDKSKLFIYQKEDNHGRNRLWNFDTKYEVLIKGATPLVGNKDLTEGKNSVVNVPNIVRDTIAESDRSTEVRSDFFDPQGRLVVTFYEDVDKDKSDIKVKGLKEIKYAEKCKTDEEGEEIRLGSSCEMEDDKSTLILFFHADKFATDESFDLELNKIESPDGFQINADPIVIKLKTYPSFQIISTDPANGASQADLAGTYVCTNSPLKAPAEDDLSYIKTDGYIVYGDWYSSRYIQNDSGYDTVCKDGEFQTKLVYGLLPQTDYKLDLSLTDDFGQTSNREISFKTSVADSKYTRFHNMQPRYNVTVPNRTKFTYAAENLDYVDVHICRMSPESFLQQTIDIEENWTPPINSECTEVITEKIFLPPRYWVNNYFQVDLATYFSDTRGHYIITISNPLLKSSYENTQIYDRTYVSVTNLAVGKKEVEYSDSYIDSSRTPANETVLNKTINNSSNLYWVNNSNSLTPIVGAMVTQYIENNEVISSQLSSFTNSEGIARVGIASELAGAVVRSGLDTAVISSWSDELNYAGGVRDASRTYVYTDRPIYRPGHTVHIRGIDRIGFDGSYEIWNENETKLEVFDSKGNSVYATLLKGSEYGTFNTDFDIPTDAPLGTYRIEVLGQSSQFDVEEYVPSAFKLEAESDKNEYINGEVMNLAVQADYYFGVPLSEGKVSYSVTAQDYYFDRYTDEYFNFGLGWYYCYSCGYGDDFLFRGEEDLNESGRAEIKRELKFEDFFDDVEDEKSKLVTVSITVKDSNGRSVSMQKSFIVHKGDFYIGSKTDSYYTGVNSPVTLKIKTVDTEGKQISLSDIERTSYKVNWETFKRQEVDGGFYYRSEKKLQEISKDKIKTDSNGNWSGPLTFSEEGQYEIHVIKSDDNGNKIKSVSNIYIYGSRSVSVPPNNNYELDIEVERTNVGVGDTASLLIKSPYDNAKVLITTERGTIYDYWIADVKGGLYLHEFPVKSEYAPNIFVSALLLSGDPEIKYGSVRYDIGTEEHELDVKVTSNKTHYLPGEEVTLMVETRDSTGLLLPAEVSLAVADLSVLALKGNPKKNPAMFFFDGFPLAVTTASNIKNILHEVDIPLGTKGGGGADPNDLAKKKRGVFKDTAFWEASVRTDNNGKATIKFTLPDNLTTWQIEGLGVTKDTKLGVDYSEFTTKKDLMAVPLKPRFVVPGDSFSLGAKVFNQTDKGTTVKVKLESDTLQFVDKQEDSVFINNGESKTIYFDVVAKAEMKAGEHTFTFTASDESFVDSVEQVIPITPNTTYETVATANFTDSDVAVEYIYVPDQVISGEGGLTINVNATMAVFMTDALSYMVTYPYGCSEQLASSLSTIGTLTEALTLPNVEGEFDTIEHDGVTYDVDTVVTMGLSQIYQNQHADDGGFAYYKDVNMRSSLPLTVHVVSAFTKLRDAGYEIDENVLRRAIAYIEFQAKNEYSKYPNQNQETVVIAEYVLRQANGNMATSLTGIVDNLINDKAFLNEKISSMSLAYLAILTADGFSRSARSQVYDALKNRIDIDGRGAYLATIETANRQYFETPIKDTALLLKVFAAQNDEHVAMGNVLRWLLASRDNRGVWGGTHNTFVVVDAMVDYLKWQHETESNFSLQGLLDGVEIFGHEFNPSNIFETFTSYIPIDDFAREKLSTFVFKKKNLNDKQSNMYYDMTLKYFLPVESLPPRDEGITITRGLYKLDDTREKNQLTTAKVGDVIKGKLTLTIPDQYSHVAVEDVIPAGFEIVNFNLATEDQSLLDESEKGDVYGDEEYYDDEYYYDEDAFHGVNYNSDSPEGWFSQLSNIFSGFQTAQLFGGGYRGSGGSYGNDTKKLRPTHIESHDDRVFLYIEDLSEGVYEYEYFLRALVPGEFQHIPARAEELFFPEVFGRTEGGVVKITPAE